MKRNQYPNDAELVRGLKRREDAAWEAFRRRYRPIILRAVCRILRSAADAETVDRLAEDVQEEFFFKPKLLAGLAVRKGMLAQYVTGFAKKNPQQHFPLP